MLKGLGTSEIKYITALSPTAISAAGSSNAIDLSKFTHGTLIVSAGSTAAATINLDLLRSGTSNGTFQTRWKPPPGKVPVGHSKCSGVKPCKPNPFLSKQNKE